MIRSKSNRIQMSNLLHCWKYFNHSRCMHQNILFLKFWVFPFLVGMLHKSYFFYNSLVLQILSKCYTPKDLNEKKWCFLLPGLSAGKKMPGFLNNLGYPLPFSSKHLHIKMLNFSPGERFSFQLCLMTLLWLGDNRAGIFLKYNSKLHMLIAIITVIGNSLNLWLGTNKLLGAGGDVIWTLVNYCLKGSAKISDCLPAFLPKLLQ